MRFDSNITTILIIISVIIVVTVINNIIASLRGYEAEQQRIRTYNSSLVTQQEIRQFEQSHQNQTQQILDSLTGGISTQDELVQNQEEIIAKLDLILNQTTSSGGGRVG